MSMSESTPAVMWRAVYEGSGDDLLFDSEEKAQAMIGEYAGTAERVVVMNADELAEWCLEAAADIDGWASYAGEYFQEKHGLKQDIEVWNKRAAMFKESYIQRTSNISR